MNSKKPKKTPSSGRVPRPKSPNKPGRPEIPDRLIAEALRQEGGNMSAAARALQCDRHTVWVHVCKNPELQQICSNARESLLDAAENSLRKQVDNGEGWAVCFTLKTLGRARGYVERQEIDQTSRVTVSVSAEDLTDDQLAAVIVRDAGGQGIIAPPGGAQ